MSLVGSLWFLSLASHVEIDKYLSYLSKKLKTFKHLKVLLTAIRMPKAFSSIREILEVHKRRKCVFCIS